MADFRDRWIILEVKPRRGTIELLYLDGFGRRGRFRVGANGPPFDVPGRLIARIRELAASLPGYRISPHNTGPIPLPVFLRVPGHLADFGWEDWLLASLGSDADTDRVQVVRLTEPLGRPRSRFRLPFRIVTLVDPLVMGLDVISESRWFVETPLIAEHGLSIEFSGDLRDALLQMPRHILLSPVPADALTDILEALPLRHRPRLLIAWTPGRPGRIPAGVSVLELPELALCRLVVPEVVYGLIHDMPLHEAVKSVQRRTGAAGIRLFSDPRANHALRISDALREVRREALKLEVVFPEPAGGRTPLGQLQEAVERVHVNVADFSQENRGLLPLVNAQQEIRLATALFNTQVGPDLLALRANPKLRHQLGAHQRRAVDIALERLDTDPFLTPVETRLALQAGARYQLRVHVGYPLPGSLMQGRVPFIDPLLPDPEKADGHDLEIVVQRKEFGLLSMSVRRAFLPRLGAMEPVYFTIRAPRKEGFATLRVCVYCKNNLLQSFLLNAEVAPYEVFRSGVVTGVRLEYSRTERFTNLDEVEPRELSIAANAGRGGTHELLVKGEKMGTVPLGDDAFTKAMDAVRGILLKATVDPNDDTLPRAYPVVPPGDPTPPDVAEVVRALADTGHELYNAFFRATRAWPKLMWSMADLRQSSGSTLQVVRLCERCVVPWTLLYDFEPPQTVGGTVCLGWVRNAQGDVLACTHGASDGVYCIRGFWGVRHRVEELISGGVEGDSVKTISPLPGREVIRLAADAAVPGAGDLQAHLQTDFGSGLALGPSESSKLIALLWEKPPQRPAVLLILGHLETGDPTLPNEPKGERIVLAPGQSWLTEADISNRFNAAAEAWDQPRPLVLLMACGSATTRVDKINDFVLALNASGAGAIVGTECAVFSDFASEFAEYLTRRLWNRGAAGQAVSLGQAMTDFRVEKLRAGNPLPFVFRSIGDADLTLQR